MIKDQVRRSKKATSKSARPSSARAASRRTPVQPTQVKRARTNRSIVKSSQFGFVVALGVFCVIAAAFWYSSTQVFSFLTTTAATRFTLITTPTQLWLLTEGNETKAHHYELLRDSELTSGLASGSTTSDLASQLSNSQTPENDRTVASQILGIPIDRIVVASPGSQTWSAILGELRSQAFDTVREGAWSDGLMGLWLAARMSEGADEPEAIEDIITTISRQNSAAISGREECSLAVLNNAGKPGLATLVSSVIEQNGGTVLRVANALTDSESDVFESTTTTFVHPASREHCSDTLALLAQFFPMATVKEDSELVDQYRASVVLLLDSDAAVATTAGALNPHQ